MQNQIYYNATPNSILPRSWNLPDGSVNLQDGRREDCARSAHVREFTKFEILNQFKFSRKKLQAAQQYMTSSKKLSLSNLWKVGIFDKYLFLKFAFTICKINLFSCLYNNKSKLLISHIQYYKSDVIVSLAFYFKLLLYVLKVINIFRHL